MNSQHLLTPTQLELSQASAGEIARTLRLIGKADAVGAELGAPEETEAKRLHAHLLHTLGAADHTAAMAEIGRMHGQLHGKGSGHSDDVAVSVFADAMQRKLADARAKGRGGWDDESQCDVVYLAQLLVEQLRKPNVDVVDIANFAMFLYHRPGGADALHALIAQAQGFKTEG